MCLIRVGAELCRTVATFNVAELQRHILVWHVYYIVLSHFSGFVCTQIFLETNTVFTEERERKRLDRESSGFLWMWPRTELAYTWTRSMMSNPAPEGPLSCSF